MRCLGCGALSWHPLCLACRQAFLIPQPALRSVPSGLEVTTFFRYDEIEPLLLTKHLPHGHAVFRWLAKSAFSLLTPDDRLYAIGIDDNPRGGYSHTAVLVRTLQKRGFGALYGVLRAKNRVSYAGKSRAFRLANPRNFLYTGPGQIRVLLVDDVVTTGLTLMEAEAVLKEAGVKVAGALALANVE
ncbi:MAG: ComF family protein [Epsilonproteobacteria bacterium]|nr:ComF family protein [Campylobacterota bacterium]